MCVCVSAILECCSKPSAKWFGWFYQTGFRFDKSIALNQKFLTSLGLGWQIYYALHDLLLQSSVLPLCLEWNNGLYFTPDNGTVINNYHKHICIYIFAPWCSLNHSRHCCLHTASCITLFQSRLFKMNIINIVLHWLLLFSVVSASGWLEFNVPFSTNTAISETKGQGWRVILLPTEGRLAIY